MNANSLTLRDVFEGHYLLSHCNLALRTKSRIRYDLNQWERRVGRLPVAQIGRDTLQKFRDDALTDWAAPTVRGILTTVTMLLRYCGPQCSTQPDALEILPKVPFVRLPPAKGEPKTAATLEQLEGCYRAADVATWPRLFAVQPATFWRCLLVAAYNTGLRRWDLCCTLRWAHWFPGERCIVLEAEKTGKQQSLPAANALCDHLADLHRLRDLATADARIFPIDPCAKQVRRELRRMSDAAGVPWLGLQAIRRRAAIEYEKAHPGAGPLLLGHTLPHARVSFGSYIPVPDVLRVAADKLPQPWPSLTPAPF